MSGYMIEDAEAISRALSEEGGLFEIPPAYARADLIPGDLATLLFDVEGRAPGEPLRVQVTDIEGPGRYFGRLVEESGDLFFGMPVAFDERNVAWIEPPQHAALSGMFDMFNIWKRKEAGQAPPPPPPQAPFEPEPPPLQAPPTPYGLPSYPRELERIPQESYPRPPVLYLPYHEEPGSGLMTTQMPLSEFRREAAPPAPVKENPWAIWNPAAQKENLPATPQEKAGAFAVWTPAPSQAPIVAPPEKEPGMFSVWNPEVMAAESAAMKEMDLWEIVVPKSEQGSMYQPEEKDPFEIFAPAPPEPMPVAPSKSRKKKKVEVEEDEEESYEDIDLTSNQPTTINWKPPTVEWMAERLSEALNLKKVWKTVRHDRKQDWFIEEQARAHESEGPVPIALQTIVNYEDGSGENLVENLFNYLDLDISPLQPLLDKYARNEDEEAWEELNEIGREVQNILHEAFEILKPDDLPGSFGITSHDSFGNQEFIAYMEEVEDTLSPQELRQLQAQREREEQKEEEKRQKQLRKLLGNWRPMTWEQAAEFLDVHYGIQQLVQGFRRAKKTKKWARDLKEYGGGIDIVEDFGEDDGDLELRVAKFLGIPMNVVDRFVDQDDLGGLWDAAIYPAFESFEEAWVNVRPEDLPGELTASSDEGDEFILYYSESEGYNEDEPEEGNLEGEE